jgi:hypothetical protein
MELLVGGLLIASLRLDSTTDLIEFVETKFGRIISANKKIPAMERIVVPRMETRRMIRDLGSRGAIDVFSICNSAAGKTELASV